MNTTLSKLTEACVRREDYVQQMTEMSDARLSRHLDIVRWQKEEALRTGKHEAYLLLSEYESQIIAARVEKNNNTTIKLNTQPINLNPEKSNDLIYV